MYTIDLAATIDAPAAAVWQAWTDLDRTPDWDSREEEAKLEGPFQVGTTLWSKQKGNPGGRLTLVAIEEQRRWTVEKPLPGGKLRVDHTMSALPDGRVQVAKRYEITGPLVVLFRVVFGPRIRREIPASFAALEREAQRLAFEPGTAGQRPKSPLEMAC